MATRLVLITALLMSMQTSAGMLMGLGNDLRGKPQAMAHCADMQDMNTADTSSTKTGNKTSCDVSCCMSFVAASEINLAPIGKPTIDFLNTPTQSPSRFTHINYRPPILS